MVKANHALSNSAQFAKMIFNIQNLKNKMYSVPVTRMPAKHYIPPLRLSLGISHL